MSGFRPDRSRFSARPGRAGLQDSMPRAALLSIHARVAGTEPATWEDPSLVQLWGPRFSVFVVAARDLPVFSLGTMPDDAKGRQRARELAADLGGERIPYGRRAADSACTATASGTRRRPAPS
jgi:Winged helix DNA-binding domain